jgi:C4-dicarboxylate-specific signal transduction histidine kinase
MKEFFARLLSSDFMGHGYCYLWRPEIVWLHVVSDALIALSYFVIPVTLLVFIRKRRDLPFHWMFVMFGVFILGCGATHVMEVWTLWHGTYRLAGLLKAITAAASVSTAVALVPLIPRALLLPSPSQLRAANLKLEQEIAERRRAEAALQAARDELELRVQQRTAELARANEQLQFEILQRRRAAEALQESQSQLAHMARVTTMGEFTASIAHEVNQPLTAVVANGNACLRWLAGGEPNLEEARAAVVRVVSEGKRAAEVIQKIRALVKKSAPEIARLDVNETIREVLALTNHEVLKRRIAVRTELAPGIPAIRADRVQLQQVLLNLIMNALEASAESPHDIVVTSERSGLDQVMVAVSDSGVGLDRDKLDRVFQPFFTTKSDGMGMGLSISRSIIEAHGGRLWGAPNQDCGATFQFTLPAAA